MIGMPLPVMPPLPPMLAKAVNDIPDGSMTYEPKWDGFRSIIFRHGEEVEIGSRKERPMTRYFPELVEAILANLPERCVIDGEIIVIGASDDRLDFELLQQRIHPATKNASDPYRLAYALDARPQRANAPYEQVDLHAGTRRGIQRFQSVLKRCDVLEKLCPEGRDRDPAAGPIVQPAAELVLEAADDLADACLGDLQPLGGAAEVQFVAEDEEHPDLALFDVLPHRARILIVAVRGSALMTIVYAATLS